MPEIITWAALVAILTQRCPGWLRGSGGISILKKDPS